MQVSLTFSPVYLFLQWNPLNVITVQFSLSFGLCDHSGEVPNNYLSLLNISKILAHCYYSVNIISLGKALSDHIMRRLPWQFAIPFLVETSACDTFVLINRKFEFVHFSNYFAMSFSYARWRWRMGFSYFKIYDFSSKF